MTLMQPQHEEATSAQLALCVDAFLDSVFFKNADDKDEKKVVALFGKTSGVNLVPRLRPVLAQSISVDAFFDKKNQILGTLDALRECYRLKESDGEYTRIYVRVQSCAAAIATGKSFDVLVTFRASPIVRISIASVTIVYDEHFLSQSPLTMFF